MPPLSRQQLFRQPSLEEAYHRYLAERGFSADTAQVALVERLQILLDGLTAFEHARSRFSNILRYFIKRRGAPGIKGIYVWGDVGRGKTFLLDLFFRELPIKRKTRVHFHEFMRGVHADLAQTTNTRAPLAKIAREFAKSTRLLYLDEFQVTDIGDAMILGELLKQLLENGVVTVMSSNVKPQDLYSNGLQRQRFLPAIALLEEHLEVFELTADCDYRLQFMSKTSLYSVPADEAAERVMSKIFHQLATDTVEADIQLEINGHTIHACRCAGGVVWFDFAVVCDSPRSAADYLEIAQCYKIVLVSAIPLFENQDDLARRFINMIDTFYDCRVRFIASAAGARPALPSRPFGQGVPQNGKPFD